jgi:deoxyribonuclease V
MRNPVPENWLHPVSLEEASRVQRKMAERVIIRDELPATIERLGGVDVSNNLRDPENIIYATMITLSVFPVNILEKAGIKERAAFPYVPGYLAFREVPALVKAYEKLSRKPDLIFVDGHGISHPRGLGIASHLGVVLDCPTIGIAKKILVGKPDGTLAPEAGSSVPLVWKGNQVGVVLRTKTNVNPVYVAPGHRISMDSAVDWVKACLTGYKLPEPTRQAHLSANAYRTGFDQVSADEEVRILGLPF